MPKILRDTIQLIFVEIGIITCAWILDSAGWDFVAGIALICAGILAFLFLVVIFLLGREFFK